MKRLVLCVAVAALGACASNDKEKPRLDLYDRIDLLRAQYNGALDRRDYLTQVRTDASITREVQHNFETFVKDAGEETDLRRRWLATFALGFSKRIEAAPVLRARLDDLDPLVRLAAAISLAVLGVPNPPIDRVKLMLDDAIPDVRLGALFALKIMLAPGQDAGLAKRLVGLLDDPEEGIRAEACQVMGRIRKIEFLEPLAKRAFRDASFWVRVNGAMAAGLFGSTAESMVPHLIRLLRDQETSVVEAAHWALKEITEQDFDRGYNVWQDWYDEKQSKVEYACPKDADVVQPTAGFCPKCGTRLEPRAKSTAPKRDEKKDDKKDDKK